MYTAYRCQLTVLGNIGFCTGSPNGEFLLHDAGALRDAGALLDDRSKSFLYLFLFLRCAFLRKVDGLFRLYEPSGQKWYVRHQYLCNIFARLFLIWGWVYLFCSLFWTVGSLSLPQGVSLVSVYFSQPDVVLPVSLRDWFRVRFRFCLDDVDFEVRVKQTDRNSSRLFEFIERNGNGTRFDTTND